MAIKLTKNEQEGAERPPETVSALSSDTAA